MYVSVQLNCYFTILKISDDQGKITPILKVEVFLHRIDFHALIRNYFLKSIQ